MVAGGGDRTTLPDSAGSSPASVRSSVDLPAPLTPTSPTTSPGATTRSRSENSTRAPWPAASPRATRVALMPHPPDPRLPARHRHAVGWAHGVTAHDEESTISL